MPEQYGFGLDTPGGFDFGGQQGFSFSQPESQHSRDERERRRRNSEENAKREKGEREQRQKDERERQERARRDEGRARHSAPWESAWDVLGLNFNATKGEIRKAWAAKMTCSECKRQKNWPTDKILHRYTITHQDIADAKKAAKNDTSR